MQPGPRRWPPASQAGGCAPPAQGLWASLPPCLLSQARHQWERLGGPFVGACRAATSAPASWGLGAQIGGQRAPGGRPPRAMTLGAGGWGLWSGPPTLLAPAVDPRRRPAEDVRPEWSPRWDLVPTPHHAPSPHTGWPPPPGQPPAWHLGPLSTNERFCLPGLSRGGEGL